MYLPSSPIEIEQTFAIHDTHLLRTIKMRFAVLYSLGRVSVHRVNTRVMEEPFFFSLRFYILSNRHSCNFNRRNFARIIGCTEARTRKQRVKAIYSFYVLVYASHSCDK